MRPTRRALCTSPDQEVIRGSRARPTIDHCGICPHTGRRTLSQAYARAAEVRNYLQAHQIQRIWTAQELARDLHLSSSRVRHELAVQQKKRWHKRGFATSPLFWTAIVALVLAVICRSRSSKETHSRPTQPRINSPPPGRNRGQYFLYA